MITTRTVRRRDGATEVVRLKGKGVTNPRDPISYEHSIVWLEDISKLPFVRVMLATTCGNTKGPLYATSSGKIVGYSTLENDAPRHSETRNFCRRVFFLTERDLNTDNPSTPPDQTIDPRTVKPTGRGVAPIIEPQAGRDTDTISAPDTVLAKEQESSRRPAIFGWLKPVGGGEDIPLKSEELKMGRRDSNDIVLRFSNVSGFHCQLQLEDGYWFIRDMNSTNGVKVAGRRIPRGRRKRIDPGTLISIARHSYKLEYDPTKLGAFGTPPPDENMDACFPKASLLDRIGVPN